jgi:hypothetical protein
MTQLPSYDPAAETRAVLHSISTPADVSPIIANLNRIASYPPIISSSDFISSESPSAPSSLVGRARNARLLLLPRGKPIRPSGHHPICATKGNDLMETCRGGRAMRTVLLRQQPLGTSGTRQCSRPQEIQCVRSKRSHWRAPIIVRKHRRRKVHGDAQAHQPASKKEARSAKAPLMAYRRPACGGNPCAECLHAALRKAGETSVFRPAKWPRGILEDQITIARRSIMLTDVTLPPSSFTRAQRSG